MKVKSAVAPEPVHTRCSCVHVWQCNDVPVYSVTSVSPETIQEKKQQQRNDL